MQWPLPSQMYVFPVSFRHRSASPSAATVTTTGKRRNYTISPPGMSNAPLQSNSLSASIIYSTSTWRMLTSGSIIWASIDCVRWSLHAHDGFKFMADLQSEKWTYKYCPQVKVLNSLVDGWPDAFHLPVFGQSYAAFTPSVLVYRSFKEPQILIIVSARSIGAPQVRVNET